MNYEIEIRKLKNKIEILEEENYRLSQNAEDILLINILLDSLDFNKGIENILFETIEKISIIKNIPFLVIFKTINNKANVIASYKNFETDNTIPNTLNISKFFDLDEVVFPYFISKSKVNTLIEEINLSKKLNFTYGLVFKLNIFSLENLYLLIIDNNEINERNDGKIITLEYLINNISIRLDKLLVFYEYKKLNNELEKKVEERTKELKLKNELLIEEIKRREEIEKELIKSKDEAIKANNLKSEFLAQMSHEIRSPLNIIIGYLGLIESDNQGRLLTNSIRDFRKIEQAVNRIMRTIDLILNMSQIKVGTFNITKEIIDINKVIDDTLFEYSIEAKKKKLEIIFEKNSDKAFVNADRYCVNQIFSNLIDNAIKFTKKGKVSISIYKNEKYLISEISDTGIGISEDFLKKIFEPFTQEKTGYSREYEGNGLGLSLVKKYCDLNDILINITSEKNKGTTVKLSFKMVN